MPNWTQAWNALHSHNGFVEGPGNQNPWTEAMHFGDCAYCSAFASVCPHQQAGVNWPGYVQVPPIGEAYSPNWEHFPGWVYDHASRGAPCDLLPGDVVTFDWTFNGVADHTETVVQVYADGSFDTIGANTGSPEGVHYPIRRDRRYLVGRKRMQGDIYDGQVGPVPAPPRPAPAPAPGPEHLVVDGQMGPATISALQRRLNVTEAYSHGAIAVDGQMGPATLRYMQQRLNWSNGPVAVDGQLGPQTIRALQAHTGAGIDGQWGPDTTRHLQMALNAGNF